MKTQGKLSLSLLIITAVNFLVSPIWADGTVRLGTDERKTGSQSTSCDYGFAFFSKGSSDTDVCTTLDANGGSSLTVENGNGYVYNTDEVLLPVSISGNQATFTGRGQANDVLYTIWGIYSNSGSGNNGGVSAGWLSQLESKTYMIAYANDPYALGESTILAQGVVTTELHNASSSSNYTVTLSQLSSDGGLMSLDSDLTNTPSILRYDTAIAEGSPVSTPVYAAASGTVMFSPAPGPSSAPATTQPAVAVVVAGNTYQRQLDALVTSTIALVNRNNFLAQRIANMAAELKMRGAVISGGTVSVAAGVFLQAACISAARIVTFLPASPKTVALLTSRSGALLIAAAALSSNLLDLINIGGIGELKSNIKADQSEMVFNANRVGQNLVQAQEIVAKAKQENVQVTEGIPNTICTVYTQMLTTITNTLLR